MLKIKSSVWVPFCDLMITSGQNSIKNHDLHLTGSQNKRNAETYKYSEPSTGLEETG